MNFKSTFLIFILVLIIIPATAQQTSQTFLELKDTGVEEFIKLHPDYDGRGTIILILDTGVDVGVDGLLKTSTGETKIIDVQDFSTEGDLPFYEAETDIENDSIHFSNSEKGYMVRASISSLLKSKEEKYFIGAFPEKHLLNSTSGARDLNGNNTTEDIYYFLVFNAVEGNDDFWVVYFDTDADGDISDEKPIRNYKEKYNYFFIPNEEGLSPFPIALNILPEEKKVTFHFDDGSHGTHCAGIAAGYNIGNAGINGVAPGAKLISLKIGNNNYTGGATVTESKKRAYIYADKLSKELKEPCIINMSFGIGSEIEGSADLELFLTDLLKNNPYLYVSVSNGNDGPGISSAGLPSSTSSVFASGAVLTTDVGRDNYGTTFENDIILYFSGRGGEVSKPDIVSPGAATSTVPNFSGGDKFWGTSMASPYSAGVMSLLLSAAQKEYPDVKIPSQLLYKILRESAVKMSGYTNLDQGAGYINVMNAYELLKKYLENDEHQKFETYTISSFAPNTPDTKSPNLYIRDGSYLTGEEIFTFNIKRDDILKTDKFYRVYNLKCDADWLKLIQKKTYIRNEQQAAVNVKFDKKKMNEPGLYNARITASRDDGSSTPEFSMMATVVIPHQFSASNNYKMCWNDQKIEIGKVNRYFLSLPGGQNTTKIILESDKNNYAKVRYRLFDANGVEVYLSSQLNSVNNDDMLQSVHYDLEPGVYELIAEGMFTANGISTYNLTVEFSSIQLRGEKTISKKDNERIFTNVFNGIKTYNLSGEILGYEKKYQISLSGDSIYRMPFSLKKGERSREFKLELSKEDFNKLTDFALMIYDETGYAVSKDGLSYRTGVIDIENHSNEDSVQYTLALIPAFVHKESDMIIKVNEITYFSSTVPVSVVNQGKRSVTLYPNSSKTLTFGLLKPEQNLPEDAEFYGKIYFRSPSSNKKEYELPLNFKF
ncbi:MAG: S8 family serine peptidase [Ignavibacteriaceae bacterium]|nr:S8 family serine peptidase [Ignavibacteriaceae bacterium]